MMDVEKQRVNLMLDSDVVALLDDLSGSERKRGMFKVNGHTADDFVHGAGHDGEFNECQNDDACQ